MISRKNILITGSAVGFGSLIARTLVAAGHTVFATMRDPEGRNASKAGSLAAFASGKSGRLRVLELDVTDEASVDAAVRRAADSEGGQRPHRQHFQHHGPRRAALLRHLYGHQVRGGRTHGKLSL